jgi:hypothetical protein
MNPKPRPNHRLYIETLRKMTPGKRLLKAFELPSFSNRLFVHGLRKKHADGLDKWPVSINGGHYPKWNPAGNALFFVSGISIGSRNLNTLMAVSVEMKEGLEIGILQKLFSAVQVGADFLAGEGGVNTLYEPSSDGSGLWSSRIWMTESVSPPSPSSRTGSRNSKVHSEYPH